VDWKLNDTYPLSLGVEFVPENNWALNDAYPVSMGMKFVQSMAETNWVLNDVYPIPMAMEFTIILPWDQLGLSWWGLWASMLLPNETSPASGVASHQMLGSAFFGPKEG